MNFRLKLKIKPQESMDDIRERISSIRMPTGTYTAKAKTGFYNKLKKKSKGPLVILKVMYYEFTEFVYNIPPFMERFRVKMEKFMNNLHQLGRDIKKEVDSLMKEIKW